MPKPNNLASIRIATLFGIANQNCNASESDRREAINELLREFRSQMERYGRGEITHIDLLLVQGIKDWGFRIFSKENPILALEKFLGTRQRRGKRAKNTDRNFRIAVAVVERMQSGMSLEDAAEAVAYDYKPLVGDSIKKIYTRNATEAKAYVAVRALQSE
jgi:hypothetical protein